ncbi:UNVERIFIED_ORG: hypothetical protein OKW14_001504 [Pantoea brenneri]|nr:hypothetical protein [Pantoea brenneri]
MSEFKGTPGPWERGGGESGGSELLVYCNNSLGSAICDATSHYSVFDKATRIANLDLIAAAPELLEALQNLKREVVLSDIDLAYIESHFSPHIDRARAAIAKALGQ